MGARLRGYPSSTNPGHLPARLANAYDRYAQGVDLLPHYRPNGPEGAFPRRARPHVERLRRAWDVIDDDSRFFAAMARELIDLAVTDGRTAGLVTRIGRNAVGFAYVGPGANDEQPDITLGFSGRQAFLEGLEATPLRMSDGQIVHLHDGLVEDLTPSGLTVRRNGAVVTQIFSALPV